MSRTDFEERLRQAIDFCTTTKSEGGKPSSTSIKGIGIFKELCMKFVDLTVEQLYKVISVYLEKCPIDSLDMVYRWRDSLGFARGEIADKIVAVLLRLCKASNPSLLSPHERLITAVTLFNNACHDVCYDAMMEMAKDPEFPIDKQVEACRYLYFSEVPEILGFVQDYLSELVNDPAYPSSYRFGVISGFSHRSGIATVMNSFSLAIKYNESFVYNLMNSFFHNDKNGIRERIMAGSAILTMASVVDSEKNDVTKMLLEFARDATQDENVRADALDIIILHGCPEQARVDARTILAEVGFSAMGGDRRRYVYSSSQNVHLDAIQEAVSTFIEKIVNDGGIRPASFAEVQAEMIKIIDARGVTRHQRYMALKALNRINVDTTPFTKYRSTLAELFVHVWMRINEKTDEIKNLLLGRLIEELVDMSETCASGHASRLVNVLATVDVDLRISWDDQITANINGRMNARMKMIKDEDLLDAVLVGMMEDADKETQEKFMKWANGERSELYEELRKEFVDEAYIKKDEFRKCFSNGWKSYVGPVQKALGRLDAVAEGDEEGEPSETASGGGETPEGS